MSSSNDLTRWNRASLSRFRYVDGNAATFLEDLRLALLERFSDETARTVQWQNLIPQRDTSAPDTYTWLEQEMVRLEEETDRQRLDRLLDQYHGERGDWGWELARVLARSCHILGEYVDAYANEGYLGTATQWDNVRRLVEMLDYHPAPPASASTRLAIEAKTGMTGTLQSGFQVKYTPTDGSAPVIFETLEDLALDVELNQLRPLEYDRNQEVLSGNKLLLEGEVEGLKIGEPLILEDEKTGLLRSYLILGVSLQGDNTLVNVTPRLSHRLRKGYAKVHVAPKEHLDPIGPVAKGAEVERVLRLTSPPEDLQAGMVIYLTDGVEEYYRRLAFVRDQRLVFHNPIGILRLDQTNVGRPVTITITQQADRPLASGNTVIYALKTAGDWSYLANRLIANDYQDAAGKQHLPYYAVTAARYHPVDGASEHKGYTILTVVWDKSDHNFALNNPQTLLVPAAVDGPWQPDGYLEKAHGHLPAVLYSSVPKKTSAGDLAVVTSGRQMAWTKLAAVQIDDANDQATLLAGGSWEDRGGADYFLGETVIHSHFSKVERLFGWQENNLPLTGNRVPLKSIPSALQKGRLLIAETTTKITTPLLVTVNDVQGQILILSSRLPAGTTFGNLTLAGNIVQGGHGESKPEKVLGNGDATAQNQTFTFAEAGVSFVADVSQPNGVRAAVTVKVGGKVWQQVGSFQDSGPSDAHYTVRMTEDGGLKITFGDGTLGRRLPTGNSNVRMSFRKGCGLSGNLAAGSLSKPVKPHYLVAKVRQPLPTQGGNDMEEITSLRENAPATLLTLERAVSLDDFAYLAMSQSSVWQARAFSRPYGGGRSEKVEVVVVPAGGGSLGSLQQTLRDFLLAHCAPGVEIQISNFVQCSFALEVVVSVQTDGYAPEPVLAAVREALQSAFSLRRRGLGQDLFLSEIYQVVEAVPGVTHSRALINGQGQIRRIAAEDKEVLVLGQLVVTQDGGEILATETVETITVSKTLRVVGQRSVRILQGVGSHYGAILEGQGIRTLNDLAAADPGDISGLTPVRLAEFRTKAQLVIGLDLDKGQMAALLDRSAADMLTSGAGALQRVSALGGGVIDDLMHKLRVLQISLDEEYLEGLTLRELLTEY